VVQNEILAANPGGNCLQTLSASMPELPEVETVRRGLAPHLDGARLVRVVARRPDLRFPLPEGFVQTLTGARIGALGRRGKYILAPLDRGRTLMIHLGMSGRFVVEDGGPPQAPGAFALAAPADPKHAHILFETDAGASLTYYDARRFGYMDFADTDALDAHPRLAGMGPEPLGEAFDAAHLARAFAGRRQGAKTLLLDQRVVAGLGNIYVCEALHWAGISPLKPAAGIGRRKLGVLARAIRAVLAEAIVAGGSTLRDHAGVDGVMGYFQHDFRVYGREDAPCPTPGCAGVVTRTVQAGRSTFHCPVCQR
jgi:formamidopyrimidine-DNA glycosylase